MVIDIDEAKANDTVGQEFEANYIPNVSYTDYDKAKTLMSFLLHKYGGRDALDATEYDSQRYRKAMYIVYSYTKGEMEKAQRNATLLRERANRLAAFWDDHHDLITGLPSFARNAIEDYNNKGLLRGLENLELLYKRADNPIEVFNNLGNELYNELQKEKDPCPILILEKQKCGRDWEFICGCR